VRKLLLKKQKKTVNRRFLLLIVILVVLGLVAVADASAPQALVSFGDKYYFLKKQLVWAAVGLVVMLVASKINYNFWKKLAVPLLAISLISLIAVLIPGVGSELLGAKRWIFLGPLSFQPSELVKLTLAIYLAKVASGDKSIWAYFAPLGLVLGLIMMQPDLGTSIIVASIAMTQIFASGVNFLHYLGFVGAGIFSGIILILTSPYRRDRLMTFISRSSDPLGKDYHIRQVLLALGSGGFWGVGLGQSRQKLLFLPEAATDSIFAVIAEEIGFVGALFLIGLLTFFIFQGFKIAFSAKDKFAKILALGIISWVGAQMIINIGAMTALFPLTGIPLPFFSYGGSALAMLLLGMGIMLNISKETHE
jgi:cell division protein FtsW